MLQFPEVVGEVGANGLTRTELAAKVLVIFILYFFCSVQCLF